MPAKQDVENPLFNYCNIIHRPLRFKKAERCFLKKHDVVPAGAFHNLVCTMLHPVFLSRQHVNDDFTLSE